MNTLNTLMHTSQGDFTLTRAPTIVKFKCARCTQDKGSKLTATWKKSDGTVVIICNGCYGYLLSRG